MAIAQQIGHTAPLCPALRPTRNLRYRMKLCPMPSPASTDQLLIDLTSLLRDVLTSLQTSHDTSTVSGLLQEMTRIGEAMEIQVDLLNQILPLAHQQAEILLQQNELQTLLKSMTWEIALILQVLNARAFPMAN